MYGHRIPIVVQEIRETVAQEHFEFVAIGLIVLAQLRARGNRDVGNICCKVQAAPGVLTIRCVAGLRRGAGAAGLVILLTLLGSLAGFVLWLVWRMYTGEIDGQTRRALVQIIFSGGKPLKTLPLTPLPSRCYIDAETQLTTAAREG